MASTTIDIETELSAVNSILGAIGQSPVTVISGNTNPEISFIYNLLRDANVDVQNEGWHFNTEKHVNYKPGTNNKITIADDILKMDVSDGWSHRLYDVVRRGGVLYDKFDHTDDWSDAATNGIDLDIVIPLTQWSGGAQATSRGLAFFARALMPCSPKRKLSHTFPLGTIS